VGKRIRAGNYSLLICLAEPRHDCLVGDGCGVSRERREEGLELEASQGEEGKDQKLNEGDPTFFFAYVIQGLATPVRHRSDASVVRLPSANTWYLLIAPSGGQSRPAELPLSREFRGTIRRVGTQPFKRSGMATE
jgi:hypothetical protein